MDTDILGAAQLGCRTVLVLSGGTRRRDIARFAYRPDIVVESVADLLRTGSLALDGPESEPLLGSGRRIVPGSPPAGVPLQ